ncbi:hypothetical protein X986_4643 [Burkholderia pseudomallei]|nr:hypothetical protein BBK_3192 [Burkholderia pseudomallei NCTC 13179]AHE34628.1 hypothetical protein BBS_3178 [Burkholderia pseudomallei NAU20B-16]AHG35707.1 hypothetical protein BBQ_1569 [Burkholderia pseudomallei MSHR511]AHG69105.1 hypothetical protein BBN_1694 [Burkholderia pseudomallei MSHR146]AIV50843.1 hypothetical protein Y603_1016 [Burkholderia pseudomallei MSHR1153]AIV61918.1 hypothetical protein X993_3417 [Burkholderia pseudomallei K42]AJX21082.1 hypothetical protein BG17_279 [Bur
MKTSRIVFNVVTTLAVTLALAKAACRRKNWPTWLGI